MIKRVKQFCLELTNHCDMSCTFCADSFMTRETGFMDTALAKRLITEVKNNNFCDRIITHLMGEPLLHNGLFEILNHANTIKQNLLLITNGLLLTRERALRILECSPNAIAISYHSGTEGSFEFRKAHISYNEYKQRIFDFIELKYKYNYKTPIEIYTISTIYKPSDSFKILDTAEEIYQFEKDWLNFMLHIKQKYSIHGKIPDSILAGRNQILPGVCISIHYSHHTWAGTILSPGTKIVPTTKCHCPKPFTECNVMWNGDLTMCCIDYDGNLVYENVNDKDLLETFNSDKANRFRNRFRQTGSLPEQCSYCFGTIENLDGSKYKAIGQVFEPPLLNNLKTQHCFFNKIFTGFYAKKGVQKFKQIFRNVLSRVFNKSVY